MKALNVFVGTAMLFSLGTFYPAQNVHAQCGYAAGLGCPEVDYNNYGANSHNPIEYDNFVSSYHATAVRDYITKVSTSKEVSTDRTGRPSDS